MIKEKIKLIIWDLDETFWNGTLSEEGINIIDENIDIIKELTNRGIVNSICSKNDFYQVESKLKQLDIWEYFVFPKIAWGPKGVQVKEIISEMGLRDNNVLFIDDNKMNLEEVKYFCPNINAYEPQEILPNLLNMDTLKGKEDLNHNRLQQYKVLENKSNKKNKLELSNVDFLKQSNIRVHIDYNYEDHIERVFEIIERTNQLNYTKVRLDSHGMLKLKEKLKNYLYSCGVIFCKDDFGDYGIVGFYLLKTLPSGDKALEHFAFSCRTMNMGIECYIYQLLGKPNIKIVGDVAYNLSFYDPVDWVRLEEKEQYFESGNDGENSHNQDSVLLLGPCNLLQLANFMPKSDVFVHYMKNNNMVKFDCPGFFLNKETDVINSNIFDKANLWQKEEYLSFHSKIKKSKKIVLHIGDILSNYKLLKYEGMVFRGNRELENTGLFEIVELSLNDKVKYIDKIISTIQEKMHKNAKLYLIDSVLNHNTSISRIDYRLSFSIYLSKYLDNNIEVIHLNTLVDKDNDGSHLNRTGYYNLSRIIKGDLKNESIDFDYSVIEKLTKNNLYIIVERKYELYKKNILKILSSIKKNIINIK